MGEQTFEVIDEAATVLEGMINELDVCTLTGPGATRLAQRLVKAERILAAGRARAIRRATEANQWRQAGERSPASWAAKMTGTSTGQAAAELETARQLEALPATQAARANGELSDLQAREVASTATADPSAEAELLRHAAIDDAAAFKRRCAKVRAAAETDEAAARERIRKARCFRSWTDAEGAFCYAGRGLAEDGAALLAAMKPYQDAAFHAARRRGEHETTDAYAYDGLMGMARHDADHHCPAAPSSVASGARRPTDATATTTGTGTGTGSGGAGGTGRTHQTGAGRVSKTDDRHTAGPSGAGAVTLFDPPPPGDGTGPGTQNEDPTCPRGPRAVHPVDPPATPDGGTGPATPEGALDENDLVHDRDAVLNECFRPGPRAKLIVRIDHTALVRGHTIPGETCEIEGVGPISVATARELARDAFLTAVVTDGIDIRTVVHLGRAATTHQRTALEARGMHCAVPGCGLVHGLEIDHVDGWAITKRTHIDQLDWLCHHHHQQKTHHSWRLAGPPGNRTWHLPG